MGTYAIDSTKQALRATGIVEPVMEWIEDATGKRRPSDTQAVDDHGVPLYGIEVSYVSESWGRLTTVVAKVTVPAAQCPEPQPFEVVGFTGLTVSVSPLKSGGLRESWAAEGLTAQGGNRKGEQAA